jgi:hypothetical protein
MFIIWSLAAAYLILFGLLPRFAKGTKNFTKTVRDVVKKGPDVLRHDSAAHIAPLASYSVENTKTAHVHDSAPLVTGDVSPASVHSAYEGFRSFGSGTALTIDDIVKGLSRESGMVFSSPESTPSYEEAPVVADKEPMYEEVATSDVQVSPAQVPVSQKSVPEPVAPTMQGMVFSDDVSGFIGALLSGDKDAVFSTVRAIAKAGGDVEQFLAHTVCALDDAYRARVDGTHVHPEIARITADVHTSFLERLVTSLATAVDSSYSAGITGTKLALTRALSIVNG